MVCKAFSTDEVVRITPLAEVQKGFEHGLGLTISGHERGLALHRVVDHDSERRHGVTQLDPAHAPFEHDLDGYEVRAGLLQEAWSG